MGIWWALKGSYQGIITIDGNNKDSIEDVPNFIAKLEEGYDFVQGSRFIPGGQAVNTPLVRYISLKLIHAPVISMTALYRYDECIPGIFAQVFGASTGTTVKGCICDV